MTVAAFDLDGTLLCHNSSYSFCRFLSKHGILNRFDLVYCLLLYSVHYFFGFSPWKLHKQAYKRLFYGKPIATLTSFLEPFLEQLQWYKPALERLKELQKDPSIEIFIFSNSPRFLVSPIASLIGVHQVVATDYRIDRRGCLCNIESFVDGHKKSQILRNLNKKSLAFSDSHYDLPFLESASQAIVVNPTRTLLKIALKRNWEVI